MDMLHDLQTGIPAFLALVAAGYALGIVGNVGGPLFVLLLLSVDRLPTTTAIGTAIFVSFLISLFAVIGHWRQENVNLRNAGLVGVTGAIGCLIGAVIALQVPVKVLEPLLGLVVLIIPTLGLIRLARRASQPAVLAVAGPDEQHEHHDIIGGAIGTIVGAFCGAFGLGGATPIAALSRMLLHQPMRMSIGSAYVGALCISFIGTIFYAAKGHIDLEYAALMATGCGLGVYLSTRTVSRIPDLVLEALMLTTMISLALFTLFTSWRAF